MTTEIKVSEEKVIGEFTQDQLNVLQHTIAKGTSLPQFDLFVQTCANSGLNPFLNHIYCIVYGQTMSIQIAVEGILYLARQKEGYKGVEAQLVHENDTFKLGRDDKGEMKVLVHDIGFPRGKVMGGYAIAKRENFEDVIVVMESSEVEQFKKGKNSKIWGDFYQDMFKKHMIKRAAKLQFGVEINEDDSFASASEGLDGMEGYDPTKRKEINDDFQESKTESKIVTDEEEPSKTEEQLFKEQWDIIAAHTKTYDLEKKDVNAIIKDRFKKKVDELSLQEVAALTKFVEIEGQNKGSNVIDVEDQPQGEPEKETEPQMEIIDKKESIVDPEFEKEMGDLFSIDK